MDPVTQNPLDLDKDLRGKKFTVVQCEARAHGDNSGCVCHLIDREVELDRPYQSPFVGTKTYHLKEPYADKRVRLSEIGLKNRSN